MAQAKLVLVKGQTKAALVNEMQFEYLMCRTLGHAWDFFNPTREIARLWRNRDSYRCTRCHTEKYEGVNVRGEVAQREYRYPEGYQTKGVPRSIFRAEMRARRKTALASKSRARKAGGR